MAKTWREFREASRRSIGENVEEGFRPCNEQLQLGAILRIADALEKVAADRIKLEKDRDRYYRYFKEEQAKNRRLSNTIAGLHGYITRLKKQIP